MSANVVRPGSIRRTSSSVIATLDDVDTTGEFGTDVQKALAGVVADHVGESLGRFHGYSVTRYSLDGAAVVILHKS